MLNISYHTATGTICYQREKIRWLPLFPIPFPKGKGCRLAEVDVLRELQVKGGEELSALMASVLDKAFKGEL
jgi:hypothetical protein